MKTQEQIILEVNGELFRKGCNIKFEKTSLGTDTIDTNTNTCLESIIDFGTTKEKEYINYLNDKLKEHNISYFIQ